MTKYVEARIGDGAIQEVAACGPTAADCGYGEQQHANARLIAAAPDLLEALEAIATEYRRNGGLGFDLMSASKMFAAIAKARGQQ